MANLLTNEIKQKIKRDLFGRKLIAVSLVVGLWLVIVAIIAGAFWAHLSIRNKAWANIVLQVGSGVKEDNVPNETASLFKKIESEVKVVNSYWSEPAISALLEKAISLKPAGLKVFGLVAERGELNKATKLSLVGLAGSRASLVNYVNSLKQDKFFTRVDLPVESLISEQGGQFVINLEK
jgi:hypothetical protein